MPKLFLTLFFLLFFSFSIISCTAVGASHTSSSPSPPSQWKVVKGMDNLFDLRPCCTYGLNISTLQQMCLREKWCAGFSSYFGTLKYSVEGLGVQSNTDMWIRVPAPPPMPTPAPTYLWPRPKSYTYGITNTTTLFLNPSKFVFESTGQFVPMLLATFQRYQAILNIGTVRAPPSNALELQRCSVGVTSTTTDLKFGVDEGYSLSVTSSGSCILTASNVFGAIRGLETFVALWDTNDRTFSGAPLVIARDAPRFPYRGLMIDTARHFLPVSDILDHLEAMSSAKLNVLHWHITDQQSWPLNLTSLPLAAQAGAYDAVLATYSKDDINSVVQSAYARGIRVIPELDMPAGHFSSILRGYPQFGAGVTTLGTTSSNLDPTLSIVWNALDGMFHELSEMFMDEQIHVGFDEVNLQDWNTTTILSWMKANNMTTLVDVESYFLSNIRAIAAKYNRKLIIWDDPVGEGVHVPGDVGLQVWNSGMDLVQQLMSQGYNVSYSSPYYLDNLGNTWDVLYSNMDMENLKPWPKSTFIGAETCMWGEQVDVTDAESRVWPRAAAFGELLWSSGFEEYPRIPSLNANRLAAWRCQIRGRNVAANPIQPGWCPRFPH